MRKALLIGTVCQINDYMKSLSYFLNISRNYNHITIITPETLQKPNKGIIMGLIKQLLTDNQPGDELWFHYIGNGNLINDVAMWPIDYEKNGFITDDELRRELIEKVRVGVSLYIVLDCVHSGRGFDLRYTYNDNSTYNGKELNPVRYIFEDWSMNQNISYNKKYSKILGNVFMLSCCQGGLNKNISIGNLTNCLLKVLKSNYGNLKWKHFLKDINCLLKIKGFNNIPQLSSGKSLDLDGSVFPNHFMVFC